MYRRINENNAHIAADIISSDSRYSELFSIHSALRLIDRYVDLSGAEMTPQEYSKKVLDVLINIIQETFMRGVDIEINEVVPKNPEQPSKQRKYSAPSMTINPKDYGKDAVDIFGTAPLQIIFCEYQPDPKYYDASYNQGLICTIFSRSV